MFPDKKCALCPRLVEFRIKNVNSMPNAHNLPVQSFGQIDAELLVVGLAPGRKGANATGRPFTGDFAGLLLYKMLDKYDFTQGKYNAKPDDGLVLKNARITNAVRCAVPQNKAEIQEIKQCSQFLKAEINAMNNLKAILTLGKIAHEAVLRVLGLKNKDFPFVHSAVYDTHQQRKKFNIKIFVTYHSSRYNVQTKRLTDNMFDEVFNKLNFYIR